MLLLILRTIYLLLYLLIASQGMFYLIGINKALQNISIQAFIEQRKSIDAIIGDPLRFLYFSSLVLALIILVLTYKNPKSLFFITVLLSFMCMIADLTLAITKSIPLNEIINHYPKESTYDMQMVRNKVVLYQL